MSQHTTNNCDTLSHKTNLEYKYVYMPLVARDSSSMFALDTQHKNYAIEKHKFNGPEGKL
jgi:hypothetical protein